MIDSDTLTRLVAPVGCGISIYMPIDRQQRDQRAPEARLRNLIDTATNQLKQRQPPLQSCNTLIETLENFAATTDFARHRDPGLAIFAAPPEPSPDTSDASADTVPARMDVVALPLQPEELVTVGPDFHIKPLLPMIAADRRFGILALSKSNVRLLMATSFTWEEVPLTVLPREVQAELDSLPAAETPLGVDTPRRKELLASNPRYVATAVKAAIGEDPTPIVLVADPNVAGSFQHEVEIRQVRPHPLHLNPFALSDQELHARVLEIMRPTLDADLEALLERINARLGTAEPTVALRLEEIIMAAREGRVDAVVVAADETLWGRPKPDGVIAHGTPDPGDEDLLNLAAVLTLRLGGRAFAVPHARIPHQSHVAATLRF